MFFSEIKDFEKKLKLDKNKMKTKYVSYQFCDNLIKLMNFVNILKYSKG